MKDFDYLSTVSGGGYTGAFLSSYLNSDRDKNIGLGSQQLPFYERGPGESQPLRHLRAHSKFLLVGGVSNSLLMLVMLVYGFLANAMILLPILSFVLLLVAFTEKQELIDCVANRSLDLIVYVSRDSFVLYVLLLVPFAFGSISFVDLLSRIGFRRSKSEGSHESDESENREEVARHDKSQSLRQWHWQRAARGRALSTAEPELSASIDCRSVLRRVSV